MLIDYNEQRRKGFFGLPKVEKNTEKGEFQKVLKRGIYKELHKRKMLSDQQLTVLLNQCERQE